MISRDSTSFPTLAVIQQFEITDPQHQTLIYMWAWGIVRAMRGQRAGLPVNFGSLLMQAFDYRTVEIRERLLENVRASYERSIAANG